MIVLGYRRKRLQSLFSTSTGPLMVRRRFVASYAPENLASYPGQLFVKVMFTDGFVPDATLPVSGPVPCMSAEADPSLNVPTRPQLPLT